LLHSSPIDISNNYLKSSNGKVYAANNVGIVIMKAIVSNHNAILYYAYNKKLDLKIENIKEDTIHNKG